MSKPFGYQWTRNDVDIPGATKYTYVTTADDLGCIISRRSEYLGDKHTEEELHIKWETDNVKTNE